MNANTIGTINNIGLVDFAARVHCHLIGAPPLDGVVEKWTRNVAAAVERDLGCHLDMGPHCSINVLFSGGQVSSYELDTSVWQYKAMFMLIENMF